METSSAIRMGTPGPPSLNTFLIEREFWKNLGLTRDDLSKRSAQEIQDYLFFMQMIQREEQAQQRRNNRGS